MGLGKEPNNDRKTYLSINQGRVIQGSGSNKQLYSYIDGTIDSIYKKDTYFGEKVTRWYIDLRDGEELYSLCLPYSSGVFKSIILALASDDSLTSSTYVRIAPYCGKNGYTKVVVYSDGVKLDWVTKELPKQELVTIGGKQVKDDSKQMELIESFCNKIIERLSQR